MKVNDFNNWKRIVFNDRVVSKADFDHMSPAHRDELLNTEVFTATGLPGKDFTTLYVS